MCMKPNLKGFIMFLDVIYLLWQIIDYIQKELYLFAGNVFCWRFPLNKDLWSVLGFFFLSTSILWLYVTTLTHMYLMPSSFDEGFKKILRQTVILQLQIFVHFTSDMN